MDKMKTVIAAAIVAVGIVVLGFCIKAGLGSFLQNQRVVTVKGLAVREVKANKVIWPIVFKELGDDLPSLYNRVDAKNQIVKKFLRSSGIEDSEISTNVVVTDLQADSYSSNLTPYRYRINSVVTVNTKKVDTVLKLIENQSSLIEQGVAISFDYSATTQFDFTDLNTVKPEMIKKRCKTHARRRCSLPPTQRVASAKSNRRRRDSSLLTTATKTRLTLRK